MCAEGEYRVPLHLMCSTTLLIVDKFTIYKVSTSSRAERQPFLSNYTIAQEKAIFIDFTSYYYPGLYDLLRTLTCLKSAFLLPNLLKDIVALELYSH